MVFLDIYRMDLYAKPREKCDDEDVRSVLLSNPRLLIKHRLC